MQPVPDISHRRKRGGQPGNTNRLRHGRYSQPFAARKAEIDRAIAKAKALLVRVDMVLRMRKALKKKTAAASQQPLLAGTPKTDERGEGAFGWRKFLTSAGRAMSLFSAAIEGPS
ncbi:MAG: hypothetical protein ACTHPD_13850 [Rhizomicrobium sp.]